MKSLLSNIIILIILGLMGYIFFTKFKSNQADALSSSLGSQTSAALSGQ